MRLLYNMCNEYANIRKDIHTGTSFVCFLRAFRISFEQAKSALYSIRMPCFAQTLAPRTGQRRYVLLSENVSV